MKLLRRIGFYYDKMLDVLAFLACMLIILTMVAVSLDVFLRTVFNAPIQGLLELIEYAMLYIAMLGAAWLLRINGHVNIDIVVNYFKPNTRLRVSLIIFVICALTCASIAYWGGVVTWEHYQRHLIDTKVLEIQKFIYLVSIPFGFSLLVIEFLRKGYSCVKKAREAQSEEKLAF